MSQALNQMCCLSSEQRCGGIGGVINTEAAEPAANRPQSNWSLPPIQSHKIDKLIVKMQNQDKFWEVFPIFIKNFKLINSLDVVIILIYAV